MIRLDTNRLVAVTGLVAALLLLVASGTTLPPPPTDPLDWAGWWAGTDPALALGAILRALAAALCAYLLLVTVLDLVASVVGLRVLSRVAHRLAPAAWRAIVLRPVAVGTLALPTVFSPVLLATPAIAQSVDVTSPTDVAPVGEEPVVITMSWQGSTAETPPTTAADDVAETTVPAPQPGPPAPPQEDADEVLPPDDTADHTIVPAPTLPPRQAPELAGPRSQTIHTVRSGDSFWGIAEERLGDALGRQPTTREVGAYWRELIAANRDRLPVPGNPDLIYPGMQLVLPAVA